MRQHRTLIVLIGVLFSGLAVQAVLLTPRPVQAEQRKEPMDIVPAEVQAAALIAAKEIVSARIINNPGSLPSVDQSVRDVAEIAYQIVWAYYKQRGTPPRSE